MSKVVPDSARPIDQIPTQSEDPLNWEEDTVVMREEANNDSDTTALYELEENLVSYPCPIIICFYCIIYTCKLCGIFYRFLKMEPLISR